MLRVVPNKINIMEVEMIDEAIEKQGVDNIELEKKYFVYNKAAKQMSYLIRQDYYR